MKTHVNSEKVNAKEILMQPSVEEFSSHKTHSPSPHALVVAEQKICLLIFLVAS